MTQSHHSDQQPACANLPEVVADQFFFGDDPADHAIALSICGQCPLVSACLQAALDAEHGRGMTARHGIFGGTTPTQREAIDPGFRCADCDTLITVTATNSKARRCQPCQAAYRIQYKREHEKTRRLAA